MQRRRSVGLAPPDPSYRDRLQNLTDRRPVRPRGILGTVLPGIAGAAVISATSDRAGTSAASASRPPVRASSFVAGERPRGGRV